MRQLNSYSIVVFTPTYNEVDNIELFIREVFEVLPQCKLLIVDDNSPDGTSGIVKKLQHEFKNLYLVTRYERKGRGYAGIEGFKKAVELNGDIIVEMDADLSHSPSELPKLITALVNNPDVDIVVGSRYVTGGEDQERSILRRIISLFARVYIKILTGINIKDVTSGYKIYRRKVVETILQYLTSSDQFIVTEVNYICKSLGFKFIEEPITFHKRLYGRSKLSLSRLLIYLVKVPLLVVRWFLRDHYNILFLKTLVLMNIVRLIIAGLFGLTDDESHYWQYAQYPDFSYYDHPPMVGYLIYLSTKIFGNNLYGVRLPAIVCFTIAVIYFYRLVKELYNSKVAYFSTLLLQVIPVSFAGSIITIPDAPLGMFWMMYMFYFYKFLTTKDVWLLYLSGFILGLAMLSKYNAVLLFIGGLLVLVSKYEFRKYFLKKDFYLYFLIVISVVSPVILWNIAHKFISFKYQFLNRIGSSDVVSLKMFFTNLSYQACYISPFVFLFVWYSIFYIVFSKEFKKHEYLLYFSLPGLLIFTILGLKTKVLPHWPTMSYFVILPLLVNLDKKRITYFISLVCSVVITFMLVLITLFGMIKIPENYADADTPDKLYGWDIAAKEIKKLMEHYEASFILTGKYYTAGQIRFAIAKYFKDDIPKVYCFDEDVNQYDFWSKDLCQYNNKNAIFIVEGRYKDTKKFINELPFKKITQVSIVSFRKNKYWPRRVFELYVCEKFECSKLPQKFVQQDYNNFISTTEFFRNYDKQIFLKINQVKLYNNKIFRLVASLITNLGSGIVLVPLTIVILFFADKNKFLNNLISFLLIVSFGGLLIQLLKNFFDKPRPLKLFYDIMHQPINVIGEQLRELGFPSGHTFLAFSTALFLSEKFKKWWLTLILFFLATAVGLSRIVVGAHFLSDVIGGFVIGIVFTHVCLKIEEEL